MAKFYRQLWYRIDIKFCGLNFYSAKSNRICSCGHTRYYTFKNITRPSMYLHCLTTDILALYKLLKLYTQPLDCIIYLHFNMEMIKLESVVSRAHYCCNSAVIYILNFFT